MVVGDGVNVVEGIIIGNKRLAKALNFFELGNAYILTCHEKNEEDIGEIIFFKYSILPSIYGIQ